MVEIILKKAVSNLGPQGSLMNVKNGYAFNYLIPQGFAILATDKAKNEYENKTEEMKKLHTQSTNHAISIKEIVDGKMVFVSKKINDAGTLYGTVLQSDVSAAINSQLLTGIDAEVEKTQIAFESKPTKYGVYKIKCNLYYGVIASLHLVVSIDKDSSIKMFEEYTSSTKE